MILASHSPALNAIIVSGVCDWILCDRSPIKGSRFCSMHDIKFGDSEPKPKKAIKIKSIKRVAEERQYKKIVTEMLAENPNCEIKAPGCTHIATGLHHKKKRSPKTYLDKRFLIRACNNCNLHVELHPLEAIKNGHSLSKYL